MPINVSELKAMQKKYGTKKGQSVYFATENSGKKSFAKGLKTAKKEGHTVPHLRDMKSKK